MTTKHIALCDDQRERPTYLPLYELALCADGKLPEWIQLVPAGEHIKALDGREFTNPNPQAIVDAFNADPRDVAVDWNHSSEIKAEMGEESPAAGWINAMEVRDGAVWGRVDWTKRGGETVTAKEYRYISPAFLFTKAKKAIIEIVSAGLVNRPALDMPAIARSGTKPNNNQPENTMTPELLALLGLAADATPEQITAAIATLEAQKAELAAAQTALTDEKAKHAETETALANARKANPTLDKFVPRADFDAMVARAKTAETTIAENTKTTHDEAVELEVAAAMKAGKVAPASKDFYVATCATADGLAQFREFVKDAPVIGEPSNLDKTKVPETEKGVMSASDKAVAASMGMSDEEFLKGQAA